MHGDVENVHVVKPDRAAERCEFHEKSAPWCVGPVLMIIQHLVNQKSRRQSVLRFDF